MNSIQKAMLAASLIVLPAGCYHYSGATLTAATTTKILQHQKDFDCPTDLDKYCGGWDVHMSSYTPATDHIAEKENFVVGRKNLGGGTQQLALFPRGDLLVRWAPPNGRVNLKTITDNTTGNVLCLVGKVKINGHGGGHQWHGIILTVSEPTLTPEVGKEDQLEMCLIVQQNGAWPANCVCEYPPTDPRQHGGRAHSYD